MNLDTLRAKLTAVASVITALGVIGAAGIWCFERAHDSLAQKTEVEELRSEVKALSGMVNGLMVAWYQYANTDTTESR